MRLKITLLIASVFIFTAVFAQNKAPKRMLRKAQKQYINGNFDKAIIHFKKVLSIDEDNYKANYELGRIYLDRYNLYDSASIYLNHAITHPTKDTIYESYMDYAKCLHLQEKYPKAIEYYTFFKENGLDNNAFAELLKANINNRIKQCQYAITTRKEQKQKSILVKNMGGKVNTRMSEYASIYLNTYNTLLYTTRYKDEKKEKEYSDYKYYENEYFFNLDTSTHGNKLTHNQIKELKKKHNAFVSKSFGEDTIILYRKNKLWISTIQDSVFSTPKLMDEKINFSEYQPHGVFSKDGKTFIFSARDKEKGKGGLDLYESKMDDKGIWSDAVLLSDKINTTKDEDSPFLSEDGNTLYFSSRGHQGFGSYDIFKSQKVNGEWSIPINLGFPINSAGDDIYLSINKKGNEGYLSSNRFGGNGAMDIYYLQDYTKPTFDCTPYKNQDFTVTFDITKSIDPNSVGLDYKWNFEDGKYKYGTVVSHTFKYPGSYKVSLDVIDKESGKIESKEEIEDINIEGVDFVGVKMDSIGEVNNSQKLDASVTQLKGKELKDCFWKIDNKELENIDTSVVDYTFDTEGWHNIDIQVVMFDGSTDIYETYCQKDSIRILSSKDFQKAMKHAESKLDSINEQLLSDATIDSMLTAGLGFHLNPVYFKFDKYYLTQKAKLILDSNIYKLSQHRNAYIIVKGYTDAMGSDKYNKWLSEKRSASVMKYLLNHGVNKERIVEVQNFGESNPVAPNTTPDGKDNPKGRQLNRRVEFQLLKQKK